MSTRDQGLGGSFHPGVGLDQVGAEPVFLLALALLHQHNPHHELGLLFPRQNPPHYAQLLLGFHVLPDPLPLFEAVPNWALPDWRIIRHLEAEGKLLHQAYSVPKDQPFLERQKIAVVRSAFCLRDDAKVKVFKLPVAQVVGIFIPVVAPQPEAFQPLLPPSLLVFHPRTHLLPMSDARQTPR